MIADGSTPRQFQIDAPDRFDMPSNGIPQIRTSCRRLVERTRQNLPGLVFHRPAVPLRRPTEPRLGGVIELANRDAGHNSSWERLQHVAPLYLRGWDGTFALFGNDRSRILGPFVGTKELEQGCRERSFRMLSLLFWQPVRTRIRDLSRRRIELLSSSVSRAGARDQGFAVVFWALSHRCDCETKFSPDGERARRLAATGGC